MEGESNAPNSAPEESEGMVPSESAVSSTAAAAERTVLQTTLIVATSAANLVLMPYVVAGRVVYRVTSFAVTAPFKVTKHVANSLSESWQQHQHQQQVDEATIDLFGEREMQASMATPTTSSPDEMAMVDGVLFTSETTMDTNEMCSTRNSSQQEASPGVVSKLIFLPVRLVSSSMSTAASLPASAMSLGGRTITGAVSSSQSLASSALVASSGLVVRTTRTVASGITQGAFSTANRVTGLVGSSVRSVSYVIPPSVSNALWHGMERTSSLSTNVISYAIAVPAFRMAQVLIPEINEYVNEQQCVDTTKDGVKMLIKVLGPQNAFYVLKFMYETVNSEEVYDGFLLCQDLLRESMDKENYKNAGASVSRATGVETLVPVVKEIYQLMPSLDELVDAALFVGDLADELVKAVGIDETDDENESTDGGAPRFELLATDEETTDTDDEDSCSSDSGHRTTASLSKKMDASAPVSFVHDAFEAREKEDSEAATQVSWGDSFDFGGGASFGGANDTSSVAPTDRFVGLFNSSVSFFGSVLDSDEAASLLNTFGDVVDVLVE